MRTALLLSVIVFVAATHAGAAGTVTTVAVPRKVRAEDAILADVNGDGRDDLLLSGYHKDRDGVRLLLVHLRRDGRACFSPEADHVLELTPDVVAFAAADVTEAKGSEVILFTATGAFAWRAGAGETERPRKLVTADLLWQLAHPREIFAWTAGLRDMDGDGLVDILLPEPGGYRVALQTRPDGQPARFDRVAALRLPEDTAGRVDKVGLTLNRRRNIERMRELRVGLSLSVSDRDADANALSVHDSVPCPILADWDADGRLDVLAMTSEELLVWRQRDGGAFELFRQEFPLTVDRGRRLDVSFGAHAGDLDGDGRADAVVLAGDRRSDEPRTQVLLYTQRGGGRGRRTAEAPLFGPRGLPDQVLLVGGFSGSTDVVDVDGNGRPDLVLGTVKVDAVDILRAESSGTIDARFYVYLNRDGRLSERPDLALTVPIATDELRHAGRSLVARFIRDVSGNRVRDLLVRDRKERIRVLAVARSRKGLVVRDKPLFETSIDDRAVVRVHTPAVGPPEVIVIEKKRVQHVRFR